MSQRPDPVSAVAPEHEPTGATSAAFFDVDNTLIRGASGFHLARALYRRRFFRRRDIAVFAGHAIVYWARGEGAGRMASVRSRALGIIAGHTQSEMLRIGEDLYEQVLESKIYPGARALVDGHLAAGHDVWFVTATPGEIGELMARRLGATGALCTIVEAVDGVYTGEIVGPFMHGERKASAVSELAAARGYRLEACWAYGDSANDLPMLSTVGRPTAINPDPHLRLHALEHDWPVRDFTRSRQRAVASGRAAGVLAAGWGLVVLARRTVRALRSGVR